MTTVLIFNDPSGRGVYGYVPEADYTYQISNEVLSESNGSNGFSAVGDGFVFRSKPDSGSEYLAFSQGGAVSQILFDTDGDDVEDPEGFIEFNGETVYSESGRFDLSITQGGGAPIKLFDEVEEYEVVGDSLYVLNDNALYRVRPDLSIELVLEKGGGAGTPRFAIDYIFGFQGDVWVRADDYDSNNDFFRYDPETGIVTEMNVAENTGGDVLYFQASGAGDNLLYAFFVEGSGTGIEPYVADGTVGDWSLVADINTGPSNSYYATSYVDDVATLGDLFVFIADDGGADEDELWVSDGTTAGTMAISGTGTTVGELSFGFGFPTYVVGDKVFFIAFRDGIGRELFVTDGTEAGTKLVMDANPGTGSTTIEFLGQLDGFLIFASRNLDGSAIWKTDGTTVEMITDPNPAYYPLNSEVSLLGIFDLDPANIPVDPIVGTSGNDSLTGTFLFEQFEGKAGKDTIAGAEGDDTIIGGAGMDVLHGQAGDDDVLGGYDDDYMNGNSGDDYLFGGVGQDTMFGGGGNDLMSGGLGHDSMLGGSGNDTMLGDAGNDTLHGGAGKDQVFGGSGNDVLSGVDGTDTVFGGLGDDTMLGGGGADVVLGGDGKDVAYGDAGSDTLSGGAGTDTVDGGSGDDLVQGDGGADLLLGGIGDDTIFGGPGNDTIVGGEGVDLMSGEGGSDVFVFEALEDSPVATPDVILDFTPGADVIDLSGVVPGLLDAQIGGSFTGTGPSLRTQEIGATTVVRVDVDGNGSSDMRIILEGALGVTESDFLL